MTSRSHSRLMPSVPGSGFNSTMTLTRIKQLLNMKNEDLQFGMWPVSCFHSMLIAANHSQYANVPLSFDIDKVWSCHPYN